MTPNQIILLIKINSHLADAMLYQMMGEVTKSDKSRRKAEHLIQKWSGAET